MACGNENKVSCEKLEAAKLEMVTAGFDPNQIADLIAQYGSDVVNLVVEAIKSGFSKQFVIDTLVKFGPMVLQFLLSWFNKKQTQQMGLAEVKMFDGSLIETFLENIIPKILNKYGEQLIDAFIAMIMKYLNKV